jgi:hypothetical protein
MCLPEGSLRWAGTRGLSSFPPGLLHRALYNMATGSPLRDRVGKRKATMSSSPDLDNDIPSFLPYFIGHTYYILV